MCCGVPQHMAHCMPCAHLLFITIPALYPPCVLCKVPCPCRLEKNLFRQYIIHNMEQYIMESDFEKNGTSF